jgi:mRNA-degrading endonuclease RelE of RelBE toxin-antitoxin system
MPRRKSRFEIRLSQDAERHLEGFSAREQRIIVDAIDKQLRHEPTRETRNRKPLRENPLANWELRVERFRVLYDVNEETMIVLVAALAVKEGNRFIIDGEEHPL